VTIVDRENPERPAAVLRGHSAPVWAMSFHDREHLFTTSEDGSLRTWAWQKDHLLQLTGNAGVFSGLISRPAFTRDGTKVAQIVSTPGRLPGISFREVKVWDTMTGEETFSHSLGASQNAIGTLLLTSARGVVQISPDARQIAFALSNNAEVNPLQDVGNLLTVVPGPLLATGAKALAPKMDTIEIYDLVSGQKLHHFRIGERLRSLQFSPDGRLLVIRTHGWRVLEIETRKVLAADPPELGITKNVLLHPDGKRLIEQRTLLGFRGAPTEKKKIETTLNLRPISSDTPKIPFPKKMPRLILIGSNLLLMVNS
jgi:WD40 repeat protein